VALIATPGIAAASDTASATATAFLTPLVDCVVRDSDGTSYDAVIGYTNSTGQTADIPYGPDNRIDPASDYRRPPTTFLTGTQHGVFALHVSGNTPTPSWTLGGSQLVISATAAAACPSAIALSASGNDTGPVMALVATGAISALLRHVARRPGALAVAAGTGTDPDPASSADATGAQYSGSESRGTPLAAGPEGR
jgi:hypothetical protein